MVAAAAAEPPRQLQLQPPFLGAWGALALHARMRSSWSQNDVHRDSSESTGAFCPLSATTLAATGWERVHGLPRSPVRLMTSVKRAPPGTIRTFRVWIGLIREAVTRWLTCPPYALSSPPKMVSIDVTLCGYSRLTAMSRLVTALNC